MQIYCDINGELSTVTSEYCTIYASLSSKLIDASGRVDQMLITIQYLWSDEKYISRSKVLMLYAQFLFFFQEANDNSSILV